MKLLIVAMSESIHTARWISNLADFGWDIHLFPSLESEGTCQELTDVVLYRSFFGRNERVGKNVRFVGVPVFSGRLAAMARSLLKRVVPNFRVSYLSRVIDKLRPDIIHTMETQNAGYLTAAARRGCKQPFPAWVHSIWGSDLYYFGGFEKHRTKIREVLSNVDVLLTEGQRDAKLAEEYGFTGDVLQIPSTGGGIDGLSCCDFFELSKPSQRRTVLVKGYQNEFTRGLVAMRALERSADVLSGYEVLVYSASPSVKSKTKLIAESTGLDFRVLPRVPHDEMLKIVAKARISIAVNLSDGTPNSMLEAMSRGAFPIQSWTSCADEWIKDGKTGLLVPPEDPGRIEKAIRRALADDELVDSAAVENHRTVKERLDRAKLKSLVIGIYETAAETKKSASQ